MKGKIKLLSMGMGLAIMIGLVFAPIVTAETFPKNTALLVVDPHNSVLHKDGQLAHLGNPKYAEEHNTIPKIAKAIELCEERGIPVIRVGIHFHHGYPTIPNRGFMQVVKTKKAFIEGTWGAGYVSGLEVKPGQIEISKKRFSSFYDTELSTLLRGLGATTLLVCGVSATHCVMATVVSAVDRDYNVIALTDAIAGPSDELTNCAFKIWALWKVKLMTVEQAFAAK